MSEGHYTSVTTIGNELFAFNDATVRVAEAHDLHHPDAAALVLHRLTPAEVDALPAAAPAVRRAPAPLPQEPKPAIIIDDDSEDANTGNTISFEQDHEVADVILLSDTSDVVGRNWTLTTTANDRINQARFFCRH